MKKLIDSNIKWVGQFPAHWEKRPIYYYFSERKAPNLALKEKNLLSLSYGKIKRKDINSSEGLLPASFHTYNIIEKDDIILRPTDLQNDQNSLRTAISKERGIITSAYIAMRATKEINATYVHYLLHTYDCQKVFYNMGAGVRQSLNFSEFSKLMLVVPPLAEQQAIASFLDKKRAEIELLTQNIKAEIAALEEYKRTAISVAVTRASYEDAEMKDSGMAWCPRIPKSWDCIPSKYLFRDSSQRKIDGDEQLTASQKYGIISQTDYMNREQTSIVLANKWLENWKHVEPLDYVISLRSFQGGIEMSKVRGCITWHYVVLKSTQPIYASYYKWLFKSPQYITALQRTCNFIRDGQDLRYSNFCKVPLPFPPLTEQKSIADFLDSKCEKINKIIAIKEEQLTTLEKYKKSLIYEYVTGKKEVPTS